MVLYSRPLHHLALLLVSKIVLGFIFAFLANSSSFASIFPASSISLSFFSLLTYRLWRSMAGWLGYSLAGGVTCLLAGFVDCTLVGEVGCKVGWVLVGGWVALWWAGVYCFEVGFSCCFSVGSFMKYFTVVNPNVAFFLFRGFITSFLDPVLSRNTLMATLLVRHRCLLFSRVSLGWGICCCGFVCWLIYLMFPGGSVSFIVPFWFPVVVLSILWSWWSTSLSWWVRGIVHWGFLLLFFGFLMFCCWCVYYFSMMISFGSWCLSVDRYFLLGECWRLGGGYVSCMAGVGLVMMVASRKISGGLMKVVSLLLVVQWWLPSLWWCAFAWCLGISFRRAAPGFEG